MRKRTFFKTTIFTLLLIYLFLININFSGATMCLDKYWDGTCMYSCYENMISDNTEDLCNWPLVCCHSEEGIIQSEINFFKMIARIMIYWGPITLFTLFLTFLIILIVINIKKTNKPIEGKIDKHLGLKKRWSLQRIDLTLYISFLLLSLIVLVIALNFHAYKINSIIFVIPIIFFIIAIWLKNFIILKNK